MVAAMSVDMCAEVFSKWSVGWSFVSLSFFVPNYTQLVCKP